MRAAASVAVVFVALLHVYALVLEMFLWKRPAGRRFSGMTPELAGASAPLAANQGLYNGFLAAGLVWALWTGLFSAEVFFLTCVIVAGLFGAATAKRSILYVQALPGAVALALLLLSR
jgi:putative membrane protein